MKWAVAIALLLAPATVGADTTVISGTTDLEDAFIRNRSGLTANNYGGHASMIIGNYSGSDPERRTMFRVAASAIPAGNIVAGRVKFYRYSDASTDVAGDLNLSAVKNANAWGEGDNNGTASDPGECAWIYSADATGWAGSNGCRTAGSGDDPTEASTDHDSTLSGSLAFGAYTAGGDIELTVTLDAKGRADLTAWRDSTRTVNGWVMWEPNLVEGAVILARSTEYGSNNPTVEIDWNEAAASSTLTPIAMPE